MTPIRSSTGKICGSLAAGTGLFHRIEFRERDGLQGC